MATTLLGDLLLYDSRYGILICRECEYAIQKSALGSHLLRHKIYRGKRQRLLSSIAALKILEPDEVQLPAAGSLPVDGLPVVSGYGCTSAGCGNLCVSSKRMRRHWSESHGVPDPPALCARPVHIQTFFRGTKTRYFEVLGAGVTQPEVVARQSVQQRGLSPVAASMAELIAPASPPPGGLDLETLKYFHHYTTATSLTLPTVDQDSVRYWQTDIIAHALRLPWLICGLLGISATHLATLHRDETTRRVHLGQSERFLQDFAAGWDEAKRRPYVADAEEARMGAQMACIHRCTTWMLDPPGPFPLRLFMNTVRGCADGDFALRSAVGSDGVPERTSDGTGRKAANTEDGSDKEPPELVNRLRSLPLRMTTVVGKPKSALDFFAVLSAIDALVECCSLSYQSDDAVAAWSGMVSWLTRVSDHFTQMAWQKDPAVLIVLAHWSLLIERAEKYCWFLRGFGGKFRSQIKGELPENGGFRDLLDDLAVWWAV